MELVALVILLLVVAIAGLVVPLRNRHESAKSENVVASEKWNTFAVISLVSAFVVSVAAIVFGHIALAQIKQTSERGWGLAFAGTYLGYVGLLFVPVILLIMIGVI